MIPFVANMPVSPSVIRFTVIKKQKNESINGHWLDVTHLINIQIVVNCLFNHFTTRGKSVSKGYQFYRIIKHHKLLRAPAVNH